MSTSLRSFACAALISTAGGSAFAADIAYEPTPIEAQPVVEYRGVSAGGWYLRGDVGHSFSSSRSGSYRFYQGGGVYQEQRYEKYTLRSNTEFSAGVGYRFNDYLRVDGTVGHWRRDLVGSSSFGGFSYDDSSRAKAWELMANAYVDIAKWGRFTPYIGGGIGATHIKYGQMKNRATCVTPAICGGGGYTGFHEGYGSWRLTWALMAGASVDITSRTKLDFGYRYTQIKGGDAYGFDAIDRAGGATGVQGRDHGYHSHAIRVGLRYEFGGADYAPVYEPIPDYRPVPIYK
ncbi:outer membrane protein [Limoniibacter endophyticus]|uniref:Outer surface protein n=1 Tax=Limoniibacter endophyticus TaxID=1565040 RepID=A0A8J3DMD1_9HYPH|nr:outer membrane beta-barrel protein [Limoniibacter endophyticus]GHC70449.1 outer surface protein [Limoniibacter endophyticus]